MNEDQILTQIRIEIAKRDVKVKAVAKKIGVAAGTLSSYLSGKRNLGLAAKLSLLRELDLDIESFKKSAS